MRVIRGFTFLAGRNVNFPIIYALIVVKDNQTRFSLFSKQRATYFINRNQVEAVGSYPRFSVYSRTSTLPSHCLHRYPFPLSPRDTMVGEGRQNTSGKIWSRPFARLWSRYFAMGSGILSLATSTNGSGSKGGSHYAAEEAICRCIEENCVNPITENYNQRTGATCPRKKEFAVLLAPNL